MLKDCIHRDMFDDVVRCVQSLLKTDVSDTARHTFASIELRLQSQVLCKHHALLCHKKIKKAQCNDQCHRQQQCSMSCIYKHCKQHYTQLRKSAIKPVPGQICGTGVKSQYQCFMVC